MCEFGQLYLPFFFREFGHNTTSIETADLLQTKPEEEERKTNIKKRTCICLHVQILDLADVAMVFEARAAFAV